MSGLFSRKTNTPLHIYWYSAITFNISLSRYRNLRSPS